MPDIDENVLQGTSITSIRMRMTLVRYVFILPPHTSTDHSTPYDKNSGRPKRTVQYTRTDDMWTYIASGKRLPGMLTLRYLFSSHSVHRFAKNCNEAYLKLHAVQWNAWLTHTRLDPPSIEVRFRRCRDTAHPCPYLHSPLVDFFFH
jgi:hypothetical protein